MNEEHVRDPDFLHQTRIKGPTLVVAGGEGQPIVLPVMSQVQSHGKVLEQNTDGQDQRAWEEVRGHAEGTARAPTMLTSDMLSMLSTCTSMPTGIAEPAKGQTLQRISVKQQLEHKPHESSVHTSARDYSCVNPTADLQCKT